jgi:ribulose-phosphate 3-epimerase
MAVICPAILAKDAEEYHAEMAKVAGFAERIQIDLTDGQFAKHPTVQPADAWWPVGINADFHLMYQQPGQAVKTILQHQPHMIIVHAEADGNFGAFAEGCHQKGVKAGVALLPGTPKESIVSALHNIDHILIFSGDLGSYGGHADLSLLDEVHFLKQLQPGLEIGWDGGVNDQNVSQLVGAGVDVLNVGGFIQKADDPEQAYKNLARIAEETGTT